MAPPTTPESAGAEATGAATPPTPASTGGVSLHYDLSYPQLSRWRRMQIPLIAAVVYWTTRLIGPTLRFEVLGMRYVEQVHAARRAIIFAFWHRCIFTATWFWRARKIVVMNTTNFDGQWTRRVIERLGYLTAQGSSSRGGLKGLITMAQRLQEGRDVAFTIDGPRGPRYVAKPGPAILARRTGQPILAFHISLERARTFAKTWDLFQVPQPFSRAVVVISPPLEVPTDASREALQARHAEMQRVLERVRDVAEGWFAMSSQEQAQLRREFGSSRG